jgi:hypothetical protein
MGAVAFLYDEDDRATVGVINLSSRVHQLDEKRALPPSFEDAPEDNVQIRRMLINIIQRLDVSLHVDMKELAEGRGTLVLLLPSNATVQMRREAARVIDLWLIRLRAVRSGDRRPIHILELNELSKVFA